MIRILLGWLLGLVPVLSPLQGQAPGRPRIAFIGLHGGVFETLEEQAASLDLEVVYLGDAEIQEEKADFASFGLVVLQHVRSEDRDHYRALIRDARKRRKETAFLDLSGLASRRLPDLAREGILVKDPRAKAYYGPPAGNLGRLLRYLAVRYLGRSGEVPPPLPQPRAGIHHPRAPERFDKVGDFLAWRHSSMPDLDRRPRVAVAVHEKHLSFQSGAVVDALIRAFEKRGMLAAAFVDYSKAYEKRLEDFAPDVVVHDCHARESVEFRAKLGALHVQSVYFRKQAIRDWKVSVEGLAPNEMAFQLTAQEPLGTIEPLVASGTELGGGGEAQIPIPERVDHLADRVAAWIRLRRKPKAEKRIAVIYWDREMGKGELMRGSATGMHLNGPKSLVALLRRMKAEGYRIDPLPKDEEELVSWMMERGRQIGIWAPEVLDRLARSGEALLIPVEAYRRWFETKVPPRARKEVLAKWGEPPGRFLVWRDGRGRPFIVVPRIRLGNVVLLPQPLKGEAHDSSRVHDKTIPPPHNYLATYFWLQEGFRADAVVHFGTHGTEFLFPAKPAGLSEADWPDVLLGTMPNVNPWIINNLGESSPVRRRAYAVLVDHLVPPSVQAGLSDELANLHGDIDKWFTLEGGALKKEFRKRITEQFLALSLEKDLHFEPEDGGLLSPEQVRGLLAYLHEIHNETTPVSLHVLGSPPPKKLLVPWIVTCLRKPFLDGLGAIVEVPAGESLTPGDREKYLRRTAETAIGAFLDRKLDPKAALKAAGVEPPEGGLPEKLRRGFETARELALGFAGAGAEIDNLLKALDGGFVPPGPSNSPDRNPAVLPTGRNMYLLNPEEVPTRPSWEIGRALVDRLLADFKKRKGRYPKRIAFTLNSFATFQDYGVMEAQILRALGVRPVWDERNLVADLELVPIEELGRPRIDVFLSVVGYYRDMLPSRMRLLDKAIRLVHGDLDPRNFVRRHSERIRRELAARGIPAEKAAKLARGRIFGRAPGDMGGGSYYYLVERSGDWDTRAELMETYIEHSCYVYTEGLWGAEARPAFERQLDGAEVLLRNWSDRTRSPLSNKYDWYKGGSLSMAIKYVTGEEPEWFFSDVRDPDRTGLVRAEDALRKDFRVRLFNRKWIEGMMREGYAGADLIAKHVSNAYGWKIMRPGAVSADLFERIVDVFVRDSKRLGIREWFERENPYAFQEIAEVLLETIRKGYWKADEETVRELARAFARSVREHGESGGILGGGNEKLKAFVGEYAGTPGTAEASARPKGPEPVERPARTSRPAEVVEGQVLEPQRDRPRPFPWSTVLALGLPLLLVLAGFLLGFGDPGRHR